MKYLIILLTFLAFVSQGANADNEKFTVEIVEANPDAGFNFPYVIRIPKNEIAEDRRFLVVESNNTGADDNFDNQIDATHSFVSGRAIGPTLATELNVPLLAPIFPRTKSEWRVYTHALDRNTLLLSDKPKKRLDLQLLSMIKHARNRMQDDGIFVSEKFALVGFSASGTFSNRFAFLHPDKLFAVVSGAVNAFPMLPVSSVDDTQLEYPLGLADFEKISGQKFNENAWQKLPQMIFMGAIDDNDAVKFDDAYSSSERKIIFDCIGKDMTTRWQKSQMIYLQKSPNVSFTTYGQVGHWTDGRINGDIVNFIKIMMRRQSVKN